MTRFAGIVALVWLCVVGAGCGNGTIAQDSMKNYIAKLDQWTKVLQGITDEASARQKLADVRAAHAARGAARQAMSDGLRKIKAQDQAVLEKQYQQGIWEAAARGDAEEERVATLMAEWKDASLRAAIQKLLAVKGRSVEPPAATEAVSRPTTRHR
jgi:hypothetical protein